MDNPKCLSWWIADSNMWKKLHDEVSAELDRVRAELDASREKEREMAAALLASDAMKERENWKSYAESLRRECDEWEAKAKKWESGTISLQSNVNRWKDAAKKLEDEADELRDEVAYWKKVSDNWYEVAAGRAKKASDGVASAMTSALDKEKGEIRVALKTAASDYFGEDYVKDKTTLELAEAIGKTLMRSEEDNTYWRTRYADSVEGRAEAEKKLGEAKKVSAYWQALLERVLDKAEGIKKELQSKNDRIAKLEEWLGVYLGIKK